eukprot:2123473-Rhodomonas_salina.1
MPLMCSGRADGVHGAIRSLGTTGGVNLLNANQVTKASGSKDVFPVIISAIVSAVDKHGMLLRVFQLASLAATIELAIH